MSDAITTQRLQYLLQSSGCDPCEVRVRARRPLLCDGSTRRQVCPRHFSPRNRGLAQSCSAPQNLVLLHQIPYEIKAEKCSTRCRSYHQSVYYLPDIINYQCKFQKFWRVEQAKKQSLIDVEFKLTEFGCLSHSPTKIAVQNMFLSNFHLVSCCSWFLMSDTQCCSKTQIHVF